MDKSIVPVNRIAARSSTCYEFSNPNGAEVVEIEDEDTSVEAVERQMRDLKLNHQFNEKDVPEIFKTLIKDRMNDLNNVYLEFENLSCWLRFVNFNIWFEKKTDYWTVTYEQANTTIETVNPEKSIIDHLWFVLRNPELKLVKFVILSCKDSKTEDHQNLDSEKLTTLLQSMIDSIGHQFHTYLLDCKGLNEVTFLSMLKHVKPGTLGEIEFDISWKNEKNYKKMEEIVETDQWKQAKEIFSFGFTPLEIDDLFHCEFFWLEVDSVTPEDVQRVVEHVFNSSSKKNCRLTSKTKKYDIKAVIDFLQSQNDGSIISKVNPISCRFKFAYTVVKFGKRVQLVGGEKYISIHNY